MLRFSFNFNFQVTLSTRLIRRHSNQATKQIQKQSAIFKNKFININYKIVQINCFIVFKYIF